MNYKEFEQKIQKEIDPRFTVVPNVNRPGLNNVLFEGKNYDLPVVGDVVKEEVDHAHRYEFPNGMSARLWSIPEMEGRLKTFMEQKKSGEIDNLYEEK